MEDFLLNLSLSWTSAKLIPYLIFLITGIVCFLLIRKRMKSKALKWVSSFILFLPIGIYFFLNPIYEGDFANDYTTQTATVNLQKGQLTVITIPGCPFCMEAMDLVNEMSARTNNAQINVKVLTTDSSSLTPYRNKSKGALTVEQVFEAEPFLELTKARFPTFVFKKGDEVRVWNNDGFGSRAKDWVEGEVE